MSFVLSSETFLKLMGVGMATAIFVDATIVRMVLVPAVMQLMGRANWWIPRWLDRALPRVGIEPQRASLPSDARSLGQSPLREPGRRLRAPGPARMRWISRPPRLSSGR